MKNILHIAALDGTLPNPDSILITDLKDWLNEKDEKGNTPLHYAAHDALANQDNPRGLKVMDWITELCQTDGINANLFLVENEEGNTPLHDLIQIANKKFHAVYIKKCDEDFKDRKYLYHKNKAGKTPWDNKNRLAVEILLELDKQEFKYEDESPLHVLCDNASKYVRRHQVKPFMFLRRNKKDETPFKCAAQSVDTKPGNLKALLKVQASKTYELAKNANCYDWVHAVIEYSSNPIAVLNNLNKNDLIIKSLNCKNVFGNTPLHVAVLFSDVPMLKYLIDRGADLAFMNNDKHTPLRYAVIKNRKENFKYLSNINKQDKNDQHAETEWQRWNAMHLLFVVFGGQKLIKALGQLPEFYNGGHVQYFFPILTANLKDYLGTINEDEKAHYQNIIHGLENFHLVYSINQNADKFADDVIAGKPLITDTGSATHVLGIIFEKQDNDIVLSYVNRGLWGENADKEGKLAHTVMSLRFPADKEKCVKVLEELNKAKGLKSDEAKEILFTKIPQIVDAKFKNENSLGVDLVSRYFKIGICFWANFKSVVHNSFINEFGIRVGQLKYKKYNLFLLNSILKYYKNNVLEADQNKALIAACEKIIQEKETKFQNDQFLRLTQTPKQTLPETTTDVSKMLSQNKIPSVLATGGLFGFMDSKTMPTLPLVPVVAAAKAFTPK